MGSFPLNVEMLLKRQLQVTQGSKKVCFNQIRPCFNHNLIYQINACLESIKRGRLEQRKKLHLDSNRHCKIKSIPMVESNKLNKCFSVFAFKVIGKYQSCTGVGECQDLNHKCLGRKEVKLLVYQTIFIPALEI